VLGSSLSRICPFLVIIGMTGSLLLPGRLEARDAHTLFAAMPNSSRRR
jgi:hypothetical protein